VGIKGGARRARIFGDQLEIAEGRHQRDHEGDQERQPDHAADLLRHLAGQGIDAGAENVADDEQQQQPRTHHAVQARLGLALRDRRGIRRDLGHDVHPL
jgi:hypothetical protein